ncbi:MAG: restriction endonuclease subunit S [Acidimicrobiales bacterium]
MKELPAGWIEVPIGMVCEVAGGSTPRTNVAEYWGGDIPWLTPDDLSRDRSQYVGDGRRCLTEAGYSSCSTQLIPAGSVLYTSRAPIGYVAIAKQAVCTNQGFKSFVPPPGLSSRYLYWYLRWATPMIRNLGSGTTFAEISGKVAKTIPLRLPPSSEQERIVAAIEEQLSRLDTAEQLLRSARSRLDPLVVSFIDVATDGFPTKPLGELIREPLRNGHSAKRSTTGSIPVFTLTAVTTRTFSQANTKLTDADPQRVGDLWAEPGDIFVERSNTPELVGTAALYAGPARRAIFPDLLIRVRCGPQLLPEYAELGLRSTRVRRYFQRVAKGIAGSMPKIDQDTVLAAELPLPPVADQARLVQEVAQNLSITESLATAVDHALKRSGQLRRAVLSRALTGQLTPQDPSDEPAAILLEKIVAKRRIESPGRRQSTRKTLSR